MQTMRHLSRSGLRTSLFSRRTLRDSLIRLNPALLLSNPVMFIVELTFFVVAAMAVYPPAFYPVASLALRVYYVEMLSYFSSLYGSLLFRTRSRSRRQRTPPIVSEAWSLRFRARRYSSREM